jgi:DNA-binding CsgD family transcriptional regulator
MVLTRQERERLVLDLYNQGKTIREIAKEARMSFRDIKVILDKTLEEKTEASKEQEQGNNNGVENNQQEPHLSLAAQAYKLFSEGKTPLEVAIVLNLGESEVTNYYKEYWKLKQLHNLNTVYEELKGDIEPFLRLYRLSKAKGMGIKQVVNLLEIANDDLPSIEERIKRLRNDTSMLQFQKRIDERHLYQLKNQIASTTKLLLKIATLSVIESLRMNPELYNFISYSNSVETASITYGSNYHSLMSPGRQHQQSFNDTYTALILEEAEKLYNKLTIELTNRVIAAAASGHYLP